MKVNVNIKANSVYQLTVGDIRKVKSVRGNYDADRGTLHNSGTFNMTSALTAKYSQQSFGDAAGITISGFRSGNKLVMKVVTGSADSNVTVFKYEYEQTSY